MSQKVYAWIMKVGIYLSFVVVFFVFSDLLFPYITSKQIYFNIGMEILLILWLGLIIKYPNWRPFGRDGETGRGSWITWTLVAYLAAITLTSFTGVDFNLSFWGDVERMLGVFHVLHFFIFFLIIITVMRERRDWDLLYWVSIAIAMIESIIVMTGKSNNYGTIGNSTYVSGYLIFNLYFAALLFIRYKNWWARSGLVAMSLVMLGAMRLTYTRGAYVGLGLSILLVLFLAAVFNKNKKIRYGSLGVAALFIVLVGLVFAYPQSEIVQSNPVLNRISQINARSNTFQTRLISWKAAWKDFPSHPVLGTGFGNYAITFDKYFDPSFYNHTRSETYFDRAHNNIVDITTTAGLVGLLTYLSIFVAAGYYLIKGLRSSKISQKEFILLAALLVAYFVQNLAVFDSLVTYMGLMVTLGYIYWLNRSETKIEYDQPWTNREFYALLIGGIVLSGIIYQYNYKPIKMLQGTIAGQIQAARLGDVSAAVAAYERALSYNTVLDRDSRASLGQLILSQASAIYAMDKAKANENLDFVIAELKKNVAYNPGDSFMQMTLGQVLNLAASVNAGSQEKFSYYSSQAEEAINKSIEASPGRVPLYFSRAQIFLTRGEKDKAIETLKYAISLNPIYPDGYCQLARVYFYYQDQVNGLANMNGCIDYDGTDQISVTQIKELLKSYVDKKDWPRVVRLYKRLTVMESQVGNNWAALASAYANNGQKDEAIAAAEKAAEVDPTFRSSADQFINQIKSR